MSSTKNLKFRVKWHQSTLMRSVSLVSVILLCAYAASIITASQGFDTIVSISKKNDIDQSLSSHLENIKELHKLRQELLVDRLKSKVPQSYFEDKSKMPAEEAVRSWLKEIKAAEIIQSEKWEISESPQKLDNKIEWQSKQVLQIFQFRVSFPRGQTFENFKKVEEVQKRSKVVATQLESEIKPALIKANSIILLFTFLVLIAAFLIVTRIFNKKVEALITGMAFWSEEDQSFRFDRSFTGELGLIGRQFNRMADEVEENRQKRLYLEKIASWQTIARKMAHEIKNPLTPIQMMITQLARGYKGDDSNYQKLLESSREIITEEVDALRKMVDHFSKFARLPEPKKVVSDLSEVVSKAAQLQAANFTEAKIDYEGLIDNSMANVDPDLIKQVVINLIKNAAEAGSENPSGCEIIVEMEEIGRNYTVHITDNGPGIPEEMLGKVFEAYFTTKHTGPNPGMGLGLAICQKILIDHFGELSVESKPGRTRFTLVIPKEENL